LSTISSTFKNDTQNLNLKEFTDEDIIIDQIPKNVERSTRNDSSIYNKQNYDIEGLIEKYCGTRSTKKSNLDLPKMI